ncbi:efflux transporter outer membrane subunit [Stutzerimonas nitrititolerans]|uniref:efflux transporter outer membrane subunit n=1 Tax=Stutzerimonas nitrititolerans TaxID=2482751 RepID=UPI002898090E|nr:efflux transporter outer membrane subunit [Stutzerimonas nitrititolerans]
MPHHAWMLLACLGLGACTVGPDFVRPQSGLDDDWQLPAPADVRSAAVRLPIDSQWWNSFGDAQLSALIERAAAENLDVRGAFARLEQSRAARGMVAAEQGPELNAAAGYNRARNSQQGLNDPSGNAGRSAYSLWQGGLNAAWELDLWGRLRREVEAADANVQVAQEAQRDVLLAVLADTARNYIQLRATQNALGITRHSLEIARRSHALNQARLAEGVATQLEVAESAAQVAAIDARLPPLQQREAQLINALSLLLAQPPQSLKASLAGADMPAMPVGPAQVPVGLPSELAERRPDVRRAEATLHAATAEVGVAAGDFYPRITLSGDAGFQALQLGSLGWDARRFAFGPSLSLPLFDGGRLRGNLHLREARQQEAAIAYRKTVLTAWHEVDDALVAYQAQQRRQASLEQAVSQSHIALESAERQYAQGAVDFFNVLSVQNALLANQAERVDSAATASLALVDLYAALGGGWDQGEAP